jgi:hypothetical protein
VAGKCGPNEEYSMLSYGLGSAKNIIFVGLKGPTDAFNYNYRTFMKSLNTIEIDEKSDIEELISKSYPLTKLFAHDNPTNNNSQIHIIQK